MKKFKKIIAAVICIVLLGSMTGCGNVKKDDGKINVVCTIFPQYDWTKEILGDTTDINLTLLLKSGTDLHSYQPTADDIVTISECDLFIYVGGESDKWVDDVIKEANNKDMVVIDMMDVLGDTVKEEEIVEGMEAEEEEATGEAEEEAEYDEHVWLSLKNAKIISKAICDALTEIDSTNRTAYEENCSAYTDKLDALDKSYQEAVDNASLDTVLFCDRFPFRYMVNDYGINYYAAFVGCSAETEASFKTITFLANKVDELKLTAVLVIDGSNCDIANTVVSSSGSKDCEILSMNSMQSVTEQDIKAGETYISVMEDNLNMLKQALTSK